MPPRFLAKGDGNANVPYFLLIIKTSRTVGLNSNVHYVTDKIIRMKIQDICFVYGLNSFSVDFFVRIVIIRSFEAIKNASFPSTKVKNFQKPLPSPSQRLPASPSGGAVSFPNTCLACHFVTHSLKITTNAVQTPETVQQITILYLQKLCRRQNASNKSFTKKHLNSAYK